jgi:hypothetical protein
LPIVDEVAGDKLPFDRDAGEDPAAVALGRKGGLKGGKARAKRMTPGAKRGCPEGCTGTLAH